jgi:hypothetical protein
MRFPVIKNKCFETRTGTAGTVNVCQSGTGIGPDHGTGFEYVSKMKWITHVKKEKKEKWEGNLLGNNAAF